ncbi:toxin-antitoxin system YwqK family antitoxin [Saccharothrix coeruleofusca]|uniref:MORN repeat protein n=1 Tax=Saccharothrix coeruleofusca TaxID=33919 RepID=A0A918AKL9_9PSEU|nr:hypothetical protein [Saccharothrix coeruleofusca]MBP2338118.1 antitoxin component YwqK of YwqJK toxin-antitoxin module [Saccharothrix coeruleofusca]GGP50637.1 hypothetical protein GCM10010185_23680 [Saccharothrix coeruleofusca]
MRVSSDETTMDSTSRVLHHGRPFTGELVDTDEEGSTVAITTYAYGIEHGPQQEWYANGAKQLKGQCERGAAVGEWRRWHPNGQLAEYNLFNKYGELLRLQRWDDAGTLLEDRGSGVTRSL